MAAAGPERPFGCGPLADASLCVVHRGGHRGHGLGANAFTTGEVAVDADAAEVPVGIDGETVMMATPVRCAIRPPVLRGRVPKDRPGTPPGPSVSQENERHQICDPLSLSTLRITAVLGDQLGITRPAR